MEESLRVVEVSFIWDLSRIIKALLPRDKKENQEGNWDFQKTLAGLAMKGLPLKLKGRLYSAFVHSVLLYNCAVWNIT